MSRTTVITAARRADRPQRAAAHGAQLNGSIAMQAKYRRMRESAYAVGRATFDDLACDPSFRDFLCLYIAEGTKRDRNRVEVCNSDLAVITVCHEWICRLSDRPTSYAIQYHADQDLDELRRYWAAGLGIQPAQIRLRRKSNSNQLTGRTWRSRYGVLTVGRPRHPAACEAAGLDGQAARVLALDCASRGVAQPGRALAFGAREATGSNPVTPTKTAHRVPAPMRPGALSERSSPALHNRILLRRFASRKGKPSARTGRKATGLAATSQPGCRRNAQGLRVESNRRSESD